MKPSSTENHPNMATYLSGFILALLLTVLAFGLVGVEAGVCLKSICIAPGKLPFGEETIRKIPHVFIVSGIFVLAVLQIWVHLRYFLHLSFTSRGRWNTLAILFTLLIIIFMVGGTLWIMHDLSDQMFSPGLPRDSL
jgi:cytochrome o ubiquinol oxidase operon protein cyoD